MQKTNPNDIAFDNFSLDHTSFEHNGNRYLLWAQNNPNSNIYIAKMSNPWTICTDAVLITKPEYNWETHGFKVNEGPSIIKRNDKIFMVYSASGTDSLYCLGMLTADQNADLLDANSWVKTPYPVFQSSSITKQYGPGHNSFTVSEDGEDDILVYHARAEQRYLVEPSYQPLYDAGRNTCAMKFYWNKDGTPNFSIPTAVEATEKSIMVTATIHVIK
jgi:GH43 family beta-xylosidase